jgi:hypothetical protein
MSDDMLSVRIDVCDIGVQVKGHLVQQGINRIIGTVGDDG